MNAAGDALTSQMANNPELTENSNIFSMLSNSKERNQYHFATMTAPEEFQKRVHENIEEAKRLNGEAGFGVRFFAVDERYSGGLANLATFSTHIAKGYWPLPGYENTHIGNNVRTFGEDQYRPSPHYSNGIADTSVPPDQTREAKTGTSFERDRVIPEEFRWYGTPEWEAAEYAKQNAGYAPIA